MDQSGSSERGQLVSEQVAFERVMDRRGSVLWRRPRRVADKQSGEGKAVVAMTLERLEEMLGLPEGVWLGAVCVDVKGGVLDFRLDGLGLPLCAEGAEIKRFESLREAWEYQSGIQESIDSREFPPDFDDSRIRCRRDRCH